MDRLEALLKGMDPAKLGDIARMVQELQQTTTSPGVPSVTGEINDSADDDVPIAALVCDAPAGGMKLREKKQLKTSRNHDLDAAGEATEAVEKHTPVLTAEPPVSTPAPPGGVAAPSAAGKSRSRKPRDHPVVAPPRPLGLSKFGFVTEKKVTVTTGGGDAGSSLKRTLFSPFVQDARIVPKALQFWNTAVPVAAAPPVAADVHEVLAPPDLPAGAPPDRCDRGLALAQTPRPADESPTLPPSSFCVSLRTVADEDADSSLMHVPQHYGSVEAPHSSSGCGRDPSAGAESSPGVPAKVFDLSILVPATAADGALVETGAATSGGSPQAFRTETFAEWIEQSIVRRNEAHHRAETASQVGRMAPMPLLTPSQQRLLTKSCCPCPFHTSFPIPPHLRGGAFGGVDGALAVPEFNDEVIFVGFYAVGYDPCQARPAYFGTYNSSVSLSTEEQLRLARYRRPETRRGGGPGDDPEPAPSEGGGGDEVVPRFAHLDYEYDSGDDWDVLDDGEDIDCSSLAGSSSCCSSGYSSSDSDGMGESIHPHGGRLLQHRGKQSRQLDGGRKRRRGGGGGCDDDDDGININNDDDDDELEGFIVDGLHDDDGVSPADAEESRDLELRRRTMEARQRRLNRLSGKEKLVPSFSGPFTNVASLEEHLLRRYDRLELLRHDLCVTDAAVGAMPTDAGEEAVEASAAPIGAGVEVGDGLAPPGMGEALVKDVAAKSVAEPPARPPRDSQWATELFEGMLAKELRLLSVEPPLLANVVRRCGAAATVDLDRGVSSLEPYPVDTTYLLSGPSALYAAIIGEQLRHSSGVSTTAASHNATKGPGEASAAGAAAALVRTSNRYTVGELFHLYSLARREEEEDRKQRQRQEQQQCGKPPAKRRRDGGVPSHNALTPASGRSVAELLHRGAAADSVICVADHEVAHAVLNATVNADAPVAPLPPRRTSLTPTEEEAVRCVVRANPTASLKWIVHELRQPQLGGPPGSVATSEPATDKLVDALHNVSDAAIFRLIRSEFSWAKRMWVPKEPRNDTGPTPPRKDEIAEASSPTTTADDDEWAPHVSAVDVATNEGVELAVCRNTDDGNTTAASPLSNRL